MVAHYKAGNAARNYNGKLLFLADKPVWKLQNACVRLRRSTNCCVI